MFYDALSETEKSQITYEKEKRPGKRLGSKIEKCLPVSKKAKIEKSVQTDPFDFELKYKELLSNTCRMHPTEFQFDQNVSTDLSESIEAGTSCDETCNSQLDSDTNWTPDDRIDDINGKKPFFLFNIFLFKSISIFKFRFRKS